jgi:hypothetical protein
LISGKARSFNGDIQVILCLDEFTLREDLGDGAGTDPHSHQNACRGLGVGGGLTAGHLERLIKKILKIRGAFLETSGADVGQIVGDDIDIQLLGIHAGCAGIERSDHNGAF